MSGSCSTAGRAEELLLWSSECTGNHTPPEEGSKMLSPAPEGSWLGHSHLPTSSQRLQGSKNGAEPATSPAGCRGGGAAPPGCCGQSPHTCLGHGRNPQANSPSPLPCSRQHLRKPRTLRWERQQARGVPRALHPEKHEPPPGTTRHVSNGK